MVADSPAPVTHRKDQIRFHDFRTRSTCSYCGTDINWMYTRFGNRLPFNADLLPRHLDPEQTGWVPGMWRVKARQRMVMAPMRHYSRLKIERVTHVAILHSCPQWVIAFNLGLTGASSAEVAV